MELAITRQSSRIFVGQCRWNMIQYTVCLKKVTNLILNSFDTLEPILMFCT